MVNQTSKHKGKKKDKSHKNKGNASNEEGNESNGSSTDQSSDNSEADTSDTDSSGENADQQTNHDPDNTSGNKIVEFDLSGQEHDGDNEIADGDATIQRGEVVEPAEGTGQEDDQESTDEEDIE